MFGNYILALNVMFNRRRSERDEQISRITELQDFIRSPPADLTEFDEVLVKRWVQKITVCSDRYMVELRSGLNMVIEG